MDELPARRYIITFFIIAAIIGLALGWFTAPYGIWPRG